jgi:hypothetical protein
VTHGPYPRQPRPECVANSARVVHAGGTHRHYEVQCRTCHGGWQSVAQFRHVAGANTLKHNLNSVFSKPAADLDFIHPTKLPDGDYAVVWAGVLWCQGGNCHTRVGNCDGGPGDSHVTYESLYKSQGEVVLKRVTKDDTDWYGRPPWKIALSWANNIRDPINGWNCTKGAQPPVDGGAYFGGTIPALHAASDWNYPPVRMTATVYGYGECQPNFQTANGEIFHTMDITLAVPHKHYDTPKWARNQWVKISNRRTGRSVRARLTDVCGCDHVDLSHGTARALKMTGTGMVTVSRP